jgi:hypothetical protein
MESGGSECATAYPMSSAEQQPEARRIGEHAQSRHLDVDDALEEKRLKSVEGSSNLSQEVDRRQAIRVHWPEATGRRQP